MKRPYFFLLIFIIGCTKSSPDPQEIIDRTLMASGSNLLNNAKIEFEFRDREYGLEQNGGSFKMVRLWKDSLGIIRDEVTNDGFIREVNGSKTEVIDSMAFKYTNSINSVLYFALLPFRLNDEAVIKEYLGEEEVRGKIYQKVKITFKQEGGGKDFDDIFIYWINKKNSLIDYLAYSYKTEGGGMRFREAINTRVINGVRIADYVNYKPKVKIDLSSMASSFENNELEELSRIELDNVLIVLD